MERRHFLKSMGSALAVGSISSLFPLLARAAVPAGQYLLMYEMGGGWDVSLGADPWTAAVRPEASDYFIEYEASELVTVGNIAYGPAMADIKNVLSEFSVVRGVFLAASDSGHPAAISMMRSGSGGKFPDLAMDFASHDTEQSLGVLSRTALNSGGLKIATYSMDDLSAVQSIANSGMLGGTGSLAQARKAMTLLAPKFKVFNEARALLIGDKGNDFEYSRIVNVAAAFKAGLSHSALFETSLQLDTHSNHKKNHLREQKKGWQGLADIVGVLKKTPADGGQSIFDRTTIVVYSEFSRTPSLTPSEGKNHNPLLNAVLVSGPGFKKSIAVGGSRIVGQAQSKSGMSYHIALPCNFQSGAAITQRADMNQGLVITPEHVMATIADSMGLDRSKFGCALPTTPSLRAILQG